MCRHNRHENADDDHGKPRDEPQDVCRRFCDHEEEDPGGQDQAEIVSHQHEGPRFSRPVPADSPAYEDSEVPGQE